MAFNSGSYTLIASAIATCLMTPTVLGEDSQSPSWQLVWSDEFNGPEIDPAKWTHEINCWGGGNQERQCYTDRTENARIDEGMLVIEAHLENSEGPAWPVAMRNTSERQNETKAQPFTSARLVTRGNASWQYARIEVRAELPRGQGTWPAIWMMPEDSVYGGWAASGEIDIMEAVNLGAPCEECPDGVEDHVHGTLHYGDHWPDNEYSGHFMSASNRAEGFHTYAIEWTPAGISWFVDGEAYLRQTPDDWHTDTWRWRKGRDAPFDQAFHLILNFAVGGAWPERENLGGYSTENFPKTMKIDWVRVYQCMNADGGSANSVECETAPDAPGLP